MEIPDQARTLTTAFLDAHGERSLESLSQRPRQTGESTFLPIHRALFDLARGSIREESPHSPIADIRRILTGVDPRREMPSILSGQVALWDILHRMLWEVEGPHRRLDVIHAEILLSRMASDAPQRKDIEIIRTAGYQISDIVNKMRTPKRYATKPYVKGTDMIDFDAAAQEEREDR